MQLTIISKLFPFFIFVFISRKLLFVYSSALLYPQWFSYLHSYSTNFFNYFNNFFFQDVEIVFSGQVRNSLLDIHS